ncbi:TPA_exp: Caffeine induced death protein CID2 [Trichophyton benhamiae CBS 112371]|uniref:Caffeine induced death protein Cid2 n=1 Tax=Arthroderma benhamiae (strain ATCC MYA-4681 / CBS 112371) TaxID=663331 RepID=D4AW42_ARTBC|nr:caffeine induced death protein Cid2 [Trichophyton benhamiae CBS 112371]EFE32582.1 caffeine induced death protein Cid2 [Trichophyton benhamiae CBS 112371]DAA75667.1 TPA_exp: Caffeine induced death protein CID2 [Trichophyton benhamiae CBS 112371]
MSKTSTQPKLSPQFCFNERALRDFLRISRSTVDDSISQSLNALVTPSRQGFDPSSTTARQTELPRHGQVEGGRCQTFKDEVLFPSWQARSDVLTYCAGVATSPDPDDPDLLLRQEESARARERVVDERLDPYSARFFPREPRTESLAMLIRNERGVERIVRSRSWDIVGERCGNSFESWEDALNHWRATREQSR